MRDFCRPWSSTTKIKGLNLSGKLPTSFCRRATLGFMHILLLDLFALGGGTSPQVWIPRRTLSCLRRRRSTVEKCTGPKWSKMVKTTILAKMTLFRTGFWYSQDQNGPKWSVLVHFGLKRSILVHLGPPTVLWPLFPVVSLLDSIWIKSVSFRGICSKAYPRGPKLRGPAAILFISRDICGDSSAKFFRACFHGGYRTIIAQIRSKMGYRTDVPV